MSLHACAATNIGNAMDKTTHAWMIVFILFPSIENAGLKY
jgi:hypothetical protein